MLAAPIDATPVRWRRFVCLLSQEELAASVLASRQTIRSIELGRSIPSVTLALAIARALDSTVEELFSSSDCR
jgi:putative transcriptional regulator